MVANAEGQLSGSRMHTFDPDQRLGGLGAATASRPYVALHIRPIMRNSRLCGAIEVAMLAANAR